MESAKVLPQGSLEENLALAASAVVHARQVLTRSYTDLSANENLKDEEYIKLEKSIEDKRDKIEAKMNDDLLRLEEDEHIYRFEEIMNEIADSHEGNCSEYALAAIDFLLKKNPNASFEYFSIIDLDEFEEHKADHAFVVIGRKPGSDPKDPKTWGPDAVICDPWANDCYPAKQYQGRLQSLTQTKNMFSDRKINKLEDFSHKKHKLSSLEIYDTNYFNQKRNVAALFKGYSLKVTHMKSALELYYVRLLELEKYLRDKYKSGDPKLAVIESKLEKVSELIKKLDIVLINLKSKDKEAGSLDYRETRIKLTKLLHKIVNRYMDCLNYSEKDLDTLKDFREKEKVKTKVMMFFNEKVPFLGDLTAPHSIQKVNELNDIALRLLNQMRSFYKKEEVNPENTYRRLTDL